MKPRMNEIIYGAGTKANGGKCCSCENFVQDHQIPLIRPDADTLSLAGKVQDKLNESHVSGLLKGFESLKEAVMVGAVIAKFSNNSTVKAVALSGSEGDKLFNVMQNLSLGKGVVLLGKNVAIKDYRSICGRDISALVGGIETIFDGGKVSKLLSLPRVIDKPSYPVGMCAAQKLLAYVIRKAHDTDTTISQLNMAEVFWKTGGKSNWSTGEVVPSCNTCQYVLPMMLCNYDECREAVKFYYGKNKRGNLTPRNKGRSWGQGRH